MEPGSPTRGRRSTSLAAAVALITVSAVLLLPGADAGGSTIGGASPNAPCREVTCTVTLPVGSRVARWVSPQVFFPANEQVLAKLVAGKQPAMLLKSYGAELCKHRFYGAATSIIVTACGSTTQLSIRAVRLKRGLRRLTVTYAADPYMGGDTGRSGSRFSDMTPITGLTWD